MSDIALKLIKENKESKETYLDLSQCGLKELPNELSALTWLEELRLWGNKELSDLMPLTTLTNLQMLYVSGTQVSDLSPLTALFNLQKLYVSYTQVSDLTPLSALKNLQELDVSYTQVSDLTPLKDLPILQQLDVSFSDVYDLSPLKNMIKADTVIKLDKRFSKDGDSYILVEKCKLNNPPIEIIKQGNQAILNYWKQIDEQGGIETINEAKVIIVGEGKSGKTTLFKKLIQSDYKLENLSETHGINIHEGLELVKDFRANLWDFGGQSLQYMTHQFFLTPRALYVLLMDTRAESPNLAYWFKIISLLGKEKDGEKISLLIVSNQRAGTTGNIKYQDVLKYYEADFDYQYLEVDLSLNDSRWLYLKEAIEQRLLALPIVKNELPKQWKNIRADLRQEAAKQHHISTARLEEICTPRQVTGHEAQFQLTNYLHQLGSVLHFQNDPDLSDTIFLSPEWVVEGVYTVLKNEDIKAHHGRFKAEDIFTILRNKGYKHDDATKILRLMSKNNFDICYQTAQGNYIAAQLLELAKPNNYKWHPEVAKDVLQFRYQYPIMPKGLMSRLIVRLSEYIEIMDGEEIAWQKGAILRIKRNGQEARLMMIEDDAESHTGLREIIIEVMGDADSRKYALQRVRDEIHSLHQRWFKNIQFNEIVPCNCVNCQISDAPKSYLLKDLLELKQHSPQKQCLTGAMVSIQQLLEGVYTDSEIGIIQNENNKIYQNILIKNHFKHLSEMHHTLSYFNFWEDNTNDDKVNEKLKVLEQKSAKNPENIEILFELGKEYKNIGNIEKVIEIDSNIKSLIFENNLKEPIEIIDIEIEKINQFEAINWKLEPNINILLGKNGFGKSYLLRLIAALLQDDINALNQYYIKNNDIKNKALIKVIQNEEEKEMIFPSHLNTEPIIPLGKIPILCIPDVRGLNKSFSSLSIISDNLIEGELFEIGAEHFIHQLPYEAMIQNRLFVIGKDLLVSNGSNRNIEFTIENSVILRLIHDVIKKLGDSNFKIVNIRDYEGQAKIEIEVLVDGSENILPLQAVSQGTISIISILSLIYSFLKSLYKQVDESEILRQRAIVIIDEIDAHLHPSWQRKIVNLLRENFPNVQFILSSHSPLVVAGCFEREVAVLRKVQNNQFSIYQFEDNFIGLQIEDIYNKVFEIENVNDDETFLEYSFENTYTKESDIMTKIDEIENKKDASYEELKTLVHLHRLLKVKQIEKDRIDNNLSNKIDYLEAKIRILEEK